jgi:tRNA U34 5-carboxymethylaminomethyl modifying GTPase MnmE/TrmE
MNYAGHSLIVETPIACNSEVDAATRFGKLLAEAKTKVLHLGPDFAADLSKLTTLNERLEEGRFHLAILGQFKRGKSTLLNALIGEPILPTSVVPLTAIPTFVEYGPERGVRVHYQDDKPSDEFWNKTPEEMNKILQAFVTEEGNPENRLGVLQVDIVHPAEILKNGVVLIDTPGIGSTFTHNTQATLNFLPQCDAALFVVSADPPLTEVEAQFLQDVLPKVSRLFFIFNKMDYLNEKEKEAAVAFFIKVLKQKVPSSDNYPIFCVSARMGLESKTSNETILWSQSGLDAVEKHLVCFLLYEKTRTLLDALSKKAVDILESAVMRLRLEIASLQMPIEDLEKRLSLFEKELKNAERQKVSAQDMLIGDRKRTLALLEEHAEALRKASEQHLRKAIDKSFAEMADGEINEQRILDVLAEEVTSFFGESAEKVTSRFARLVVEALSPHQERADELISQIRKTAAELFEIPYHAPDSSEVFETKRRPYWVQRKRVPSLPIVVPEEVLDRFLSVNVKKNRIRKRFVRQVEILTHQNVENLRWATLQNLNDAFHRFATMLDERFVETIGATHGAIQAAYIKRKEHAESIDENLQRLSIAAGDLVKINSEILSLNSR